MAIIEFMSIFGKSMPSKAKKKKKKALITASL